MNTLEDENIEVEVRRLVDRIIRPKGSCSDVLGSPREHFDYDHFAVVMREREILKRQGRLLGPKEWKEWSGE